MSGAFEFGSKVLQLYAGANFQQWGLRPEDHERSYKGKKIPISVTISSTYHCNLKCAHCQAENDNGKPDPISTERFLRLIDEIADAGATKVGFTGGEPMIRKDFGQVIERCVQRGLVVSVVANGWLVKKNIDQLKGVHLLFLSLDGDRAVHDAIRGPGNFDKFLEAVEAAKEAGIPVAALSTLMAMNFGCVREMSDIVTRHGLHWMVGLIQTGFTKRSDQDLSAQQVREALRVVAECRNLRTSKKYLRCAVDGKPMRRCFAGIGYCVIAPDGTLYPCFPAQFDHESYWSPASVGERPQAGAEDRHYKGVSILDKPFGRAFEEMTLYRKTCDSCYLACHAEANYLYEFRPENVLQSFRLMKPAGD